MTKAFEPNDVGNLRPLGKTVLAYDMNFEGRTLSSGIILLNDNGKSTGIRPRWGRVYAVGPDQTDVKPGDIILVAHGRWTRGVKIKDSEGEKVIRKIDHNDILLTSDSMPTDDTISDAVLA